MLHQLVKRQLKKLGLDETTPPEVERWQQFLERVSQSYIETDRERYLLERSLTISSREMQELYESLQQASETQLAEERDKLQAVISSVGDGLCALDQDGHLLFINPAGEQLLGWKEAELVGRPVLAIVEKRDRPEQFDPAMTISLADIVGAGQLYRNEDGYFMRNDGTTFPTSYVLNPIMKEGVLLGAVLVFRDITERKQTEVELQRYREHLEEQVVKRTAELTLANQQLQQEIIQRKQAEAELIATRDHALQASRLKTELLAKVSHELRTPLGAILGFAEILQEGFYGSLSAEQHEMTAEIIDSSHYLTGLINELLDQAQLDAGKLKLNINSFSLAEMVEPVLSKMSMLAQAKGLLLTPHIATNVPPHMSGDVTRIQQILVNLISNAIKFTQVGAIQVYLYCPDPDRWAIQVADTGIGIPQEAQAYIFEPFRQVDGSITREYVGTGLGLSIVKQLTALMGGQITLKSEVGEGSTFTVILPLKPTQKKRI